MTTSCGKLLEDISHAHLVSLMQKLLTSRRGGDNFSLGFHRNRGVRRDELTLGKSIICKYHLRIMLKVVFGFAEHQEKATFGLGYKLTFLRDKDDAVIDKTADIVDARTKKDHIHWYVGIFTPYIQQQSFLSNRILSKTPTELRYIERSVFLKELNNQNLWNFEPGSQESMNVPIWIVIGSEFNKEIDKVLKI